MGCGVVRFCHRRGHGQMHHEEPGIGWGRTQLYVMTQHALERGFSQCFTGGFLAVPWRRIGGAKGSSQAHAGWERSCRREKGRGERARRARRTVSGHDGEKSRQNVGYGGCGQPNSNARPDASSCSEARGRCWWPNHAQRCPPGRLCKGRSGEGSLFLRRWASPVGRQLRLALSTANGTTLNPKPSAAFFSPVAHRPWGRQRAATAAQTQTLTLCWGPRSGPRSGSRSGSGSG